MELQFVIMAVALLGAIHLVWRTANEYHQFLFAQWRREMSAKERRRANEQAKRELLEKRKQWQAPKRSPQEIAERKKVIMKQVESTLGTKRAGPGRASAPKKG